MNYRVKIGLYVLLTLGVILSGYFFYSSYNRLMTDTSDSGTAASVDVPALERKGDTMASRGYAKVLLTGGSFVIIILTLGFFVGHDISQFLGNRFLRAAYNDEGIGMSDPDYELAEQEWADGHHLDAVRLMRDYLKKYPREQHVAIRIAEIYEKDLLNPLAAALEYEEILKSKLPPERWGWAAIHLCNLYFKLNQPDKAVALLRRIDAEYSETAAADKARKRLALYDGSASEALIEESAPADEGPST